MIRNEEFRDGVCVAAEVIDVDARTISFEENGVAVSTRALTDDEYAAYTYVPPLSEAERLAAAQAALAPLEDIAAPYTAADIVDVLLDVKTALGG